MSHTKKIKKGISSTPHPQIIEPSVDGELVDIKSLDEQWSEYGLKDGTTLRLKPVIVEIRKLKGQRDANGNPIYYVKSTVITDVKRK